MLRRHGSESVGPDPDTNPDPDRVQALKDNELSAATSTVAPITPIKVRPTITKDATLVYGSLAEAASYAVFLLLLVLATAVVDEDPQSFYFASRVEAALTDRLVATAMAQAKSGTSTTMALPPLTIDTIHDQGQVWSFLSGPFADVVYGSETNETGLASASSVLLGGVRLRTVRVQAASCPSLEQLPEYAAAVPFCYGRFSISTQQTRGYGPVLNSGAVAASAAFRFSKAFFADKETTKTYADLQTCNSDCVRVCGEAFGVDAARYTTTCQTQCTGDCKCLYEAPAGFSSRCADPSPTGAPASIYAYNWTDDEALSTVKGPTGTRFPRSGYVVTLGVNGSLARTTLAALEEGRYLDLATRVLVVDLAVWNAYLQLVNAVQVVVEFPPAGGAVVDVTANVLQLFRYSSHSAGRIALELLLVVYMVIRTTLILRDVLRARGWRSFLEASRWRALTLAHAVVFFTVVAVRLYIIDLTYGVLSGSVAPSIAAANTDSASIPNFQGLAQVLEAERILASVHAALAWLQLLPYAAMDRRVDLLLLVLGRAGPDLLSFAVGFLVCACGFAQAGFLLFGLEMDTFRSLGAAVVTMLHAVGGGLDFGALTRAHAALGPLFFVAYYLLLLLVLVNVSWAILSDAFAQTAAEQEEVQDDTDASTEDANDADVAADRAWREAQKLRRYPFSRGLRPALRLLVADVRRAVFELRPGHRLPLAKVDPLEALGSSVAPGDASGLVGSRKLRREVRSHVEVELRRLEGQLDVTRQVAEQQTQLEQLRAAIDQDVGARLAELAEGNQRKTQRLNELEGTLGAVERLCQRLVDDTAFLRADGGEQPSSRRSSGSQGQVRAATVTSGSASRLRSNKNASLSAAILANRQRELLGSGSSKRRNNTGGDDVEEISL